MMILDPPSPPSLANLYISIHPCRSVCDCSGVTAALLQTLWWIYLPPCKKHQLLDLSLCANSPAAVGLRCSLSTTNETLWQRNFCNFCHQTVMNNPEGMFDLISVKYNSTGTQTHFNTLHWFRSRPQVMQIYTFYDIKKDADDLASYGDDQ